MTLGVCHCTMGPPPGGRCAACGAYGPSPYSQAQPVQQPGTLVIREHGISPEDVRRIVREELERALKDDAARKQAS